MNGEGNVVKGEGSYLGIPWKPEVLIYIFKNITC